jgi:hypothetical protein
LFSAGIPELQMLPVEPLEVNNINIQDGIGRPVKMSLDFNNAKLHGLTQCRLKSVRLYIFNFFISSVSLLQSATWLKKRLVITANLRSVLSYKGLAA